MMKPVILCGHGSSGTTLLSALMDGHSDILVYPNESYLLELITIKDDDNFTLCDQYLETNKSKYHAKEKNGYVDDHKYLHKSRERLFELLKDHNLIESIVFDFAENNVGYKKYFLEKTPGNENFLNTAKNILPKFKTIYVIRDPRDVFISHSKKMRIVYKNPSIENFIYRWFSSINSWKNFQREYQDGILIKYEDLVQNRTNTLKFICDYLGVEFEDILLTPTFMGRSWKSNTLHRIEGKSIRSTTIGRWKNIKHTEYNKIIETFLGKEINEFQYELDRSLPVAKKLGYSFSFDEKRKMINVLYNKMKNRIMLIIPGFRTFE